MKPSTFRLSEVARHLAVADGIVSTGWPAVKQTCVERLGLEFDPWQDAAGRVILAKRENGTLAAMVDGVGMSLPRQTGKTHLFTGLVFALCINRPGTLAIWTAQHQATSAETFKSMQSFSGRTKVQPFIQAVYKGSGDEEVRFVNGSRILFGARERGFGRGIPGVDILIFDEAQILSDKAMANMLATMNTSSLGLQLYAGTPPKPEDQSEAFKRMRREALAGTLADGSWIEFGADPEAADDDHVEWRRMNPSFPARTPVQSMERLRRKLSRADWRREGMGVWDSDQSGSRAIPADVWAALGVDVAPVGGEKAFAVAFSLDGSRVALAGASRGDESTHVELIDMSAGTLEQGIGELADWLASRWRDSVGIALSGRAGAGVLAQALRDRRVPDRWVTVMSTPQVFEACGMFLDATRDGSVTHLVGEGQAVLDDSVAVTDIHARGQGGAWAWKATVPAGDETPLEAVSFAYWVSRVSRLRGRTVSVPAVGGRRRAVIS